MSATRLLIIDDDPDVLDWLVEDLSGRGFQVLGCEDPTLTLEKIEAHRPEIVLADVEMPQIRGLDLMERVHQDHPGLLFVLMSGFATVDLAVEGLRRGAADFVTKPFTGPTIEQVLRRVRRERAMRREVVRLRATRVPSEDKGLIARSQAMTTVLSRIDRAARTDVPILLTGESGVGKSALARRVHEAGERRKGPLLTLNCAALPVNLVESELFGVRKGAFTDARQDRDGVFQQARGGTFFLDEIGEMPLSVQPKLLHALESGRVRPVGATADVAVDVRIIAATNRDLQRMVAEGRFREDLLFRLDVVRVHVPPLRERPADLLPLIDTILAELCERLARPPMAISREAMAVLVAHDWPGNVRELRNVLERATVLAQHDALLAEDVRPASHPPVQATKNVDQALATLAQAKLPLSEIRERYIETVLETVDGNKSEAARLLGIDRRTLYRR
ncbi:MAG: sigma-54-dependent Fis family transcriptional regulator [Deltaproteobacteria bacterium]|nr:MAG: sigma-54-dependent Fis family transcriptional regulator [Deltaproteobacteria bacterium]